MADFAITTIRAVPSSVTEETGLLAKFTVDLGAVSLAGCAFYRRRDGELRVSPPRTTDRRSRITLEDRTRERMLKAACRAYEGLGYELPED